MSPAFNLQPLARWLARNDARFTPLAEAPRLSLSASAGAAPAAGPGADAAQPGLCMPLVGAPGFVCLLEDGGGKVWCLSPSVVRKAWPQDGGELDEAALLHALRQRGHLHAEGPLQIPGQPAPLHLWCIRASVLGELRAEAAAT